MIVSETPRWTLCLFAKNSGIDLVRYVNLGVGYLTPDLTVDLGDMIERGQEWNFGSMEG